ncbi:MAG: hypothetical protein IPH03_17750 [Tetrasphaera sp.]|nr:hypothetical protein [Tetrasphaera sp.]
MKTWLPHRRRLHQLGIAMIVGILVEAVVGGITVWTGSNPVIVAFNFLATIVLIAIATAMLRGAQDLVTTSTRRSRTLLVLGPDGEAGLADVCRRPARARPGALLGLGLVRTPVTPTHRRAPASTRGPCRGSTPTSSCSLLGLPIAKLVAVRLVGWGLR